MKRRKAPALKTPNVDLKRVLRLHAIIPEAGGYSLIDTLNQEEDQDHPLKYSKSENAPAD